MRLAPVVCAVLWTTRALADPVPQCPPEGAVSVREVAAGDVPIAHTPLPGGYKDHFPDPVLAACTEPLAPGTPDLRGLWKTLRAEQVHAPGSRIWSVTKFVFWNAFGAERERAPVPAGDPIYDYVERIEQCGNRIVDMGGGTIADARADGSQENGVRDVSAFDFETPIHVVASYEDGVFVLRPVNIPFVAVTRRLDVEGHLVWRRPDLGDRVVTLERIGGPCDKPPGTRWAR
jgi:hypothetical protein